MEKTIKARFTEGVFKPLEDVSIKEGTEVNITISEENVVVKEKETEKQNLLKFFGIWKNRSDEFFQYFEIAKNEIRKNFAKRFE